MGGCQNYGPFLGPYFHTGPYLGDPERDHNFDNPPYEVASKLLACSLLVFELGRPLSISTFWGSSLNHTLNELSL